MPTVMLTFGRRLICLLTLLLLTSGLTRLHAQGIQTGTLRGTVVDQQQAILPGATVVASSPALQGQQEAVSDANGVFLFRALPPGTYELRFSLPGFQELTIAARVELGLETAVNVTLRLAGVTENVEVRGQVPSAVISPTGGANFTKAEVDVLPTAAGGRTLVGIAAFSPGLSTNTPNGSQLAVSGAFAFDNVFLIDGVDVQDNLFGSPDSLFVEDAIEEVQVLTSGISAEYGRFSGGVVNAITRSGSNRFSGSYRVNLSRPSWTNETPFERSEDTERPDNLNTTQETTFGGPLVIDRLWFFASGRLAQLETADPLPLTGVSFTKSSDDRRGEIKLTGTLAAGHTLQGSYFRNATSIVDKSFGFTIDPDPSLVDRPHFPNDRFVISYRGVFRSQLLGAVQYSRKNLGFRDSGGSSTALVDSPIITVTQELAHYNANYFDATDPEDRNNTQLSGSLSWLTTTARAGTHDFKTGLERFVTTNTGGSSQTATGYVFYADFAADAEGKPTFDSDGRIIPVFVPGQNLGLNWLATRGATIDIRTLSWFLQDAWTFDRHWTFNLGVRYEQVRSDATGDIVGVDTDTWMPRLAASYDPTGSGSLVFQGTYGRYSGKYDEAQFAGNTTVGNPSLLLGVYVGPPGAGRSFAPGFDPDNYLTVLGDFPTANVFFDTGLSSPTTDELTLSVGSQVPRGFVEGLYVWRNTSNFVEDFITLDGGTTTVVRDGTDYGTFQNRLFRNTDDPVRRYQGLQFQGRYDLSRDWHLYAGWTVQLKNEGNYQGEASNQPAVESIYGDWPELHTEARHYPVGRLPAFQRHRARLWSTYTWPAGRWGSTDFTVAYRYDSPRTFSFASGGVPFTDIQLAGADGYVELPPDQTIFFGGRGTGEFEPAHRVDLSARYQIPVASAVEPYLKIDVLNVFDSTPLVAYNTLVFPDYEGPVDQLGLPTTYETGPRFGEGTSNGHYPLPRTFFMAFGLRF